MPDRKAKTRVVEAVPREAYCPICGTRPDTTASAVERFGEVFCSETHADEFTQAVRAARVQAAIARRDGACERGSGASAASGWTARLGRLLCWGGPALALVAMALILSGGGGLLLGGRHVPDDALDVEDGAPGRPGRQEPEPAVTVRTTSMAPTMDLDAAGGLRR
jgi:hypothetical protein